MSGGKITEARMDELRAKIEHRDNLKERLEREREEMEELKTRIDEAQAEESMSSSAAEAQKNRGKKANILTMNEELETKEIAITRLEETYADAVKELEDLKEWQAQNPAEEK